LASNGSGFDLSDFKSLKNFCLQDQSWLMLEKEEEPLLRWEVLQSMEKFAEG
jgi:hypothetical protein